MVTDTDQISLHEERARFLLDASRSAEAADLLAEALHDHPREARLRLLASEACEELGELPEAADHLSHILVALPEHLEANRRLAALLAELGDTHGAIACWRRVLAAGQGRDPDAATFFAIALCTAGRYDGALSFFSRLAQESPREAGANANLAMALSLAGRGAEAAEQLERALELDPLSAQAHCGQGIVLKLQGRLNEAAQSFQQTERLAPQSAVGSFNLGLVLEELGDREGARRALLRAAALQPEDDDIQATLESLLVRQAGAEPQSSPDGAASIRGALESFDLVNLLEFLRLQEKTGSLVVSGPQGVGIVCMQKGMLTGGSAPGIKPLSELLVTRKLVDRGVLQRALSSALAREIGSRQEDGRTVAELVLREELVSKEELARVLFEVTLHTVEQVSQWREGAFAFHAGSDEGTFPIRFNVQEVVLELMRLEDERRRSPSEAAR